ncbi:programmed cell death 1 ligand 1 isoform 4-T6 [Pangshura tecta]
MENALLLCIFLSHWHFLNALFTVEVPQPQYTVEYGSNVTMECRFQVNGKLKLQDLSVIWEKKEEHTKEVYKLHKGRENLNNQHSNYKGRVNLLKHKLQSGQSMLQITSVKPTDAGTYLCLIGYEGADYKTITLQVKDCPVRSQRINSRHYFATVGAVLVFFGSSLLFMLWVKKARKDQDRETCTNNAAVKAIKLSTDEEEGNCREISPENEELENVRIEVT